MGGLLSVKGDVPIGLYRNARRLADERKSDRLPHLRGSRCGLDERRDAETYDLAGDPLGREHHPHLVMVDEFQGAAERSLGGARSSPVRTAQNSCGIYASCSGTRFRRRTWTGEMPSRRATWSSSRSRTSVSAAHGPRNAEFEDLFVNTTDSVA